MKSSRPSMNGKAEKLTRPTHRQRRPLQPIQKQKTTYPPSMTVSVIFPSGAKPSTSNTQPASGNTEEKPVFLLLSIGCVSVRPLLISSHQRRNQKIVIGYSQSRNRQFSNSSDWLIVFLRFI